jgi:hypothetical protein
MFLLIAGVALAAGAVVYLLHPASFTLASIKAEIEKVETELSTELARAESLVKAGITASQAEAKSIIARLKVLL